MARITAQHLPPPKLETKPLSDLCKDYVNGYCREGDHCTQKHDICLVLDPTALKPTHITTINHNALSSRPRASRASPDQSPFDEDDLPGSLSKLGPRHDNDFHDIRQIRVLPTTDEILSVRSPYMPSQGGQNPHFLRPGPSRLIDTLFRQLRYDGTETIVDACYHALQLVAGRRQRAFDYQLETPRGMRYNLFTGAEFEELIFHDKKGIMVRMSFDCPHALRGRTLCKSSVLEDGMLVAVVGVDRERSEAITTFFEVHLRESTESMKVRTRNDLRAAVQLSFADRSNVEDVRRMLYYFQGLMKGEFVIVDLPRVLLPGFGVHLKRLQELSAKQDFAFSSLVAPEDPMKATPNPPPAYAADDNFEFQLDGIRSENENTTSLTIRPSRSLENDTETAAQIDTLIKRTTLDAGQARALYENLSRGLAFCVGPPGTGKTFLGVALAQVILASQNKRNPKPILCVTQTNHALDSFLGDLVEKGMDNIVRLGGGSKETWTGKYLLREQSRKMKTTRIESAKLRESRAQSDALWREGVAWCELISDHVVGWNTIKDHLKTNYRMIFDQFSSLESVDGQNAEAIKHRTVPSFAYEYWCQGGDLNDLSRLIEVFDGLLGKNGFQANSDSNEHRIRDRLFESIERNATQISNMVSGREIWSLPMSERRDLIRKWEAELDPTKVLESLAELHRRHQAAQDRKKEANKAIDARCLEGKQIIGATTTACAQYWPLLNDIGIRVVICEEAGECLEAHSVLTLFPSVQHAIFIGDPLQLRPHVNQIALSMEFDVESRYRLNESLFERLMFPREGNFQSCIPSKLHIQRRMHPEIAELCRATLYPYLTSHESTYNRPPVAGMVDRMYWLDHKQHEDRPDPRSPMSTSYSNRFEVEMVACMVQYLIKGNAFNLGDIAILTPYRGQLAALSARLSAMCSVWLSDTDRENLIGQGLLPADDFGTGVKTEIDMINLLRISTIESFQGEEAKVVILSTVRSNENGLAGFMALENRINVAFSRARDGFYVIGNASLYRSVEMFQTIIEVFARKGTLGNSFKTCCTKHTEHLNHVYEPEQFLHIPRCPQLCLETLPCGHVCKDSCHPPDLHTRIPCTQPCEKLLDCGHRCQKQCFEKCGGCTVEVASTVLRCQHVINLTCEEVTSKAEVKCNHLIERQLLPCRHYQDLTCSSIGQVYICQEDCGVMLRCGHSCQGRCAVCRAAPNHPPCRQKCGRQLICGHSCAVQCHTGQCPPCEAPCERSCQHGVCSQICSLKCDPCVKACNCECKHQGSCGTMCSLPCGILPCGEPCTNILPCGHICPSLCGENCITKCLQCETGGSLPAQIKIELRCGHVFDLKYLDSLFGIADFYRMGAGGVIEGAHISTFPTTSLTCPECETPVNGVRRYEIHKQLRAFSEVVDRMYAKFGRKLNQWVAKMSDQEQQITASFGFFCKQLRQGPFAGKTNQRLMMERGNIMAGIQENIVDFRKVVMTFDENIDSLAKFFDNPEILAKSTPSFKLRHDYLFHRCRLVTLEDAKHIHNHLLRLEGPVQHVETLGEGLKFTIIEQAQENINALGNKIDVCREHNLKRLEVELRLLQVCFHMILASFSVKSQIDGNASLKRVKSLCSQYPDTAGKLVRSYNNAKSAYDRNCMVGRLYDLFARETRELWRDLGKHEVGSLKRCSFGHPYSAATFQRCPECGREVKETTPVFINFKEKEFLAAMRDGFLKAWQPPTRANGPVH